MKKDRISAKKLRKFRRLLLAKQEEVLRGTKFSDVAESHCVPADASHLAIHTANSTRGNLNRTEANKSKDGRGKLLASIEDALARIDAGTYGVCDGDGELIGRSRLETVPWTRYCAKCARLAQIGLLSSEASLNGSDNNERRIKC
ncbi:MAG: TraR/DksA family transcriptional regulator [Planctomycetota bacterium]|jgi:RNA polymerase-binding transcription factor DksA